ncbi:N-acetyltransferase GCN5 [Spirilliplanes yamanashiensis]|uniref:N-acetyltransferase GCN5 n=1 Tax=Spirilliplanes yamanashiensis TaxID=42233 RepID=A0A8J3YCW6_9ACTN|nr:N-acetyltransferase GCN5 [Spirilliplanes yamanashiensis]
MRLRDVVDADLETLFAQEQEPEANRLAHFPARPRDAFLAHWRTRILGNPDGRAQAVEVDGELAGSIVAWWQDGRRFVGYWFGRAFWGRGVGTAALRLFLAGEAARPLYADPHADNVASVRLLEKCGFRREGTNEDGFVTLVLRD